MRRRYRRPSPLRGSTRPPPGHATFFARRMTAGYGNSTRQTRATARPSRRTTPLVARPTQAGRPSPGRDVVVGSTAQRTPVAYRSGTSAHIARSREWYDRRAHPEQRGIPPARFAPGHDPFGRRLAVDRLGPVDPAQPAARGRPVRSEDEDDCEAGHAQHRRRSMGVHDHRDAGPGDQRKTGQDRHDVSVRLVRERSNAEEPERRP